MGKFGKMAKSKNHTSHNQGYKNHRNGIFKVRRERYTSNKMVNQKLNRNTRRARKFDPTVKKNKTYTKKIRARIALKATVLQRIKDARIAKICPPSKTAGKNDKKKAAPAKDAPKKK